MQIHDYIEIHKVMLILSKVIRLFGTQNATYLSHLPKTHGFCPKSQTQRAGREFYVCLSCLLCLLFGLSCSFEQVQPYCQTTTIAIANLCEMFFFCSFVRSYVFL